ncbi:MAG: CPBP family intramembrane metalloprotease [Acidobacteriota bacterium]|nr:CPBP family intramembrane metalloprotease [Acidobacteriota bacterium]
MSSSNIYPSLKKLVLITTGYSCLLTILSIISAIVVNLGISLLRLLFQKTNLLVLQPSDDAYYFFVLFFQQGMLILTTWLCLRFSLQNKQILEEPFLTKSRIILYGFIGAAFLFGLSNLLSYLTRVFYGELNDPVIQSFRSFSLTYKILFAVLGSFVAPICEELLFRRALFGVFRQYNYIKSGIVFSSILFTLLHFNTFSRMGIFYCISFFVAGIVLAIVYNKTNSILTSIVTHVLVNTISFLLYFCWFT